MCAGAWLRAPTAAASSYSCQPLWGSPTGSPLFAYPSKHTDTRKKQNILQPPLFLAGAAPVPGALNPIRNGEKQATPPPLSPPPGAAPVPGDAGPGAGVGPRRGLHPGAGGAGPGGGGGGGRHRGRALPPGPVPAAGWVGGRVQEPLWAWGGGGGGRHRGRAPSCTESSSRGGIAEGRRAGAKAVVRIVVWGEDAPEVAHSPLDRFQQRGGWCVWRGVGGWGGGGKVQELLCRIVRGKGAIKVAHSLLECLQQRGGFAGGWQALRPRIPASPLSQHTRAHHHHHQHHLQMQTV